MAIANPTPATPTAPLDSLQRLSAFHQISSCSVVAREMAAVKTRLHETFSMLLDRIDQMLTISGIS